jgi:sugar fermentation stimulation protein A
MGKIQNRYKRFFADVILEESGEKVTAHVPNTGSMKGTWEINGRVALLPSNDPKRKLPYTLVMSYFEDSWIGLHTGLSNSLVREYLETFKFNAQSPFAHDELLREVKIGKSRLDFCLLRGTKKHYIEVKNVTMADKKQAIFPDSVTERGLKHLQELQEIVNSGETASLFFCNQRGDVKSFRGASEIDPEYCQELLKAAKIGVNVFCGKWNVCPEEISFSQMIPWEN